MHDRPAWREVLGILVACALLLAILAKLDNQAAREYQARAQKAIAAREAAQVAAAEAKAPQHRIAEVDARTESLGGRGPIAIPVGPAWTGRTKQAEPPPAARATAQTNATPALLMAMLAAGLAMAAAGGVLLSRRPSA